MDRSGWNEEDVATLSVTGGFALDLIFSVPSRTLADLFARMGVLAERLRIDVDADLDGLASGMLKVDAAAGRFA